MVGIYKTVYEASYGTVESVFKEEMTLSEAVTLGQDYCKNNNFIYLSTEEA